MKKIDFGQYNTKKDAWLKEHIKNFILKSNKLSIFDPFAGSGDILNQMKILGYKYTNGADIDKKLCEKFGWKYNDSLIAISKTKSIIVTNPPYLAKNSAKRKDSKSYKYFINNNYEDLYQIAIDKCLKSSNYVVAIIPETYILSNKNSKKYLYSITILEENPFMDTDCPVCVCCFDKQYVGKILVYKNDKFLGYFDDFEQLLPINNCKIKFNCKDGNLGLRGIDGIGDNDNITFCKPEELNYNIDKIKTSSRAITVIKINEIKDIDSLILKANNILNKYRKETGDLFLAPFKGNKKNGVRRRRIDFSTARAIIEMAMKG